MSFPHVTIARRRRLKYIRIAVQDSATIRLTVPISYSDFDIQKILERKRDWILKNVLKFRQRDAHIKATSTDTLFLGEQCTLQFAEFTDKKVTWIPSDKTFILHGDLRIGWQKYLTAWQRKYAKKFIIKRVEEISETVGYSYGRISIRNQRSRWGSCSSRGNLAFNWKLIKAPPEVLDYVIYHELAHLKIFSHSKAFWALVESLCPGYKEAKFWLKNHGHVLHSQ